MEATDVWKTQRAELMEMHVVKTLQHKRTDCAPIEMQCLEFLRLGRVKTLAAASGLPKSWHQLLHLCLAIQTEKHSRLAVQLPVLNGVLPMRARRALPFSRWWTLR